MSRLKGRTSSEICADCSAPGPEWASINRGVLICDECCSVHRSLGRHISQVRHLRLAPWNNSLINMVKTLVSNGANQIWEHSLSDSVLQKPGLRKPNPKDSVHPVKSNFIKAKYQMLAFVHRLPSADDRVSITERSKQLYASVRNSNLETSLRLISLGAQPNYFNTEKGLTPLHLAAINGQALQCELLICHGADPSALDASERTAAKLAIDNGHIELGFRLIELMYELTDRLTFYLCGRRPDHKNGINYLIPALQDRGIDVSSMAQEARLKLQSLNNRLFEEICSDIYDEVDRRENDAVWLATQHHRKLVSDHTAVPFLPVNPSFSSTRNQGRQKLARFNALEFATLIVDILHDAKRREGLNIENQSSGVVEKLSKEASIVDTDPDYDEVHEEEEKDKEVFNNAPPSNLCKQRSFFMQESFYDIPSTIDDNDDDYDDVFEPAATDQLKVTGDNDEKGKLHELQEQNNSLGQEVNLLRSMVQKLMQENAALRAQVAQVMLERNDVEQRLQAALDGYSIPPKRVSVSTADSTVDGAVKNRDDGVYDNVAHTTDTTVGAVGESSEESAAYRTEDDVEFNGPSQQSIVDATEQITQKIQELLKAAQSSNNSSYVECSSNISSAVNDMANLFPENTGSENVRNALRLMITSAARLQVQCRSNQTDQAMLAQQVIYCAYDIAKAAKLVVTTYNTS